MNKTMAHDLSACPVCGGAPNCPAHWVGWLESDGSNMRERHTGQVLPLRSDQLLYDTGVSTRVYQPRE